MRPILLASILLAVGHGVASANECNLYTQQEVGELQVGCPLTFYVLAGTAPQLPTFTHDSQPVETTVTQDHVVLLVELDHYPSPDSCDLEPSFENRTFDRYVMTFSDLQAGEVLLRDGGPDPYVVKDAGTCTSAEPSFSCDDPIQWCGSGSGSDGGGVGSDQVMAPDDGCTTTHAPNAGAVLLVGAVLLARRRRR